MRKAPAVGPGQGEESESGKLSPPIAPACPERQVDPRAAILLRASARYHLVREGAMTLDEAFSPDFVDDFLTATNSCPCQRAQILHFDRLYRRDRAERLRRWRRR